MFAKKNKSSNGRVGSKGYEGTIETGVHEGFVLRIGLLNKETCNWLQVAERIVIFLIFFTDRAGSARRENEPADDPSE